MYFNNINIKSPTLIHLVSHYKPKTKKRLTNVTLDLSKDVITANI